MHFNVIDTYSVYRRLLAETDAAAESMFRETMIAPYEGLWQIFARGQDPLAQFRMWGMYAPQDIANGYRERVAAMLETMSAADVWGKTEQALETARAAFAPYLDRILLSTVNFGVFLANLSNAAGIDRGYTGFGGMPGYIMLVVSDPNEYVLPRLQGCTAHELFHNIHFSVRPFNIATVTVGEYVVAEGLAESFAAHLYDKDAVWFYVNEFDEAQTEQARRIIGENLHVTGFNEVRGYIFGDAIARQMNLPPAGVPDYAGYAIGFRVVQQFLQRTGKTPMDAAFLSWEEIVCESGYFE